MKIRNKYYKAQKMVRAVKNTFYCILTWMLCASFHPYYVSVTDIKYNETEKTLQISCRVFADNLEDALRKIYKKPVDILHPKDKKEAEGLLSDYLSKHLKVKVAEKLQAMNFIGYEREEEAVWCYLEIKNMELPKSITIENTLLYDYLPQQMNMVHTQVKDKKQSAKVSYPEKDLFFDF